MQEKKFHLQCKGHFAFLNSLILKLTMLLSFTKHILELGQRHVQSMYDKIFGISLEIFGTSRFQNKNFTAMAPEMLHCSRTIVVVL